jgi:hypothetical protein
MAQFAKKVRGALCKIVGIYEFWNYSSMVNPMNRSLGLWTGSAVSSRWTKGGADTRHSGVSPERGTPGAAGLWSSSVEAREGDYDEAAPMRGSPGHDRQQRGSTTAAELLSGPRELLNA